MLVLQNAEVLDVGVRDVLVRDGVVAAIGRGLPADAPLDCAGAALLPGLHDHHIHLLATAALDRSVPCGPPEVLDADGLRAALSIAEPVDGWVRGVGYVESVAGDLDADRLDRIRADVPVRVQHRSGALWMLNTAAVQLLGAEGGRLWRRDDWLRHRLGPPPPPDLEGLSRRLAAVGVTGVTDATPELSSEAVAQLTSGAMAQRVVLLGDPSGTAPLKLVLADHDEASWFDLAERIVAVRPRPVALHSVTRASLLFALSVLGDVGVVPGDRVEHAAVAPPEAVQSLARLGVAVVTQPSLPARRGDSYLDEVDADDQPWLWPYRSLCAAGVPVACSSDAPYGDVSPWYSIAAAVERRTASGRVIGAGEAVQARTALGGYLTAPHDPGGPERRVVVGAAADLTLLDRPLGSALTDPGSVQIRHTWIGGVRCDT